MTVLVTGATGRAGWHVARLLQERGHQVRAAVRDVGATGPWDAAVTFSFTDPATWDAAFTGVDRMFLMRPPQIGNVKRDMLPALERARQLGVRRMVLLSLQGAEHNPVVPHHDLEKWLRRSGLEWTFVRAAFFMQNLSTTHAADIREHGRILLPAGRGRTAFVDVRDVAEVAALALDGDGHVGKAYTPTGSRPLTYQRLPT
ncbi:SDR family oxidoreductase [Micromonospora sp. NPDC049497]|uniref:SDR family oxidoreductase n=1 Tax=Micromonospora sp. NPDC049497 TaxID=3364273 RepID=UPI0037917B0E